MNKRPLLLLLPGLVAAAALGLYFYHYKAESAAAASGGGTPALVVAGERVSIPESSPLRRAIVVSDVGVSDATRKLVIPAMVEADPTATVNVLPPVAGKVVELHVKLGDHVREGQLLAVISSGDLAQAQSDRDKAVDARNLAKKAWDRAVGVNGAGANAVKDIEAAKSALVQADSELERAEAKLNALGLGDAVTGANGRLSLLAPVSGGVTAIETARGAFANDPTATLLTITNLDKVYVTASVAENELRLVSKGDAADITLTALPGEVLHGKVHEIFDIVEPDTRRNKVRILFDNRKGKLKPNMFATAVVRVVGKPLAVIPQSALVMKNDATIVFVEVEPWVFTPRAVTITYDSDDSVRVVTGIVPGERVVTKGGVLLND